jgi:outer membrane protein assembly factor BamA
LLYVDPWLLDSRFALRARLYSQTIAQEGYTSNQTGVRGDLSRKVMPHLELAAFVQAQTVKVTQDQIQPQDLGPLDYTLVSVGLTQNTDYRDDPINPSRGFVVTSSIDVGQIDSELAFWRGTVRVTHYQPIGSKLLLALGARAGYISPLIDDLPIDVRFFNGGATTVRSFAERKLGPKDSGGNPLGGEFYTVFNAELTFPLYGALQGAVFTDAGSLRNEEIPGSGNMRYAIGGGLRYKLPIGPLRLDYGLNPDPQDGEETGAFHFSFGFAF